MAATIETEVRIPPEIRLVQERTFAAMLRQVLRSNRFYQRKYAALGFTPDRPVGLSDRGKLPFTSRAELLQDQRDSPPFGTNLTLPHLRYTRVHRTPEAPGSSLNWLDTAESWNWWLDRWVEALSAAGAGAEDRIFATGPVGQEINPWAAVEAAQRLGAMVATAACLDYREQVEIMASQQVGVLVATPTEALGLAEAAVGHGSKLARETLRIILHDAGSHVPSTEVVSRVASAWGAPCFALAGSAEIGTWGFSCHERDRLHVNEAEFIIELIDPKSGDPAPVDKRGNQHGELVLTNLGRAGSPLIRYLTGQIVRLTRRPCPCGRSTAILP